MKKLAVVALATIMTLSLAACGKESPATTETPVAEASVSTEVKAEVNEAVSLEAVTTLLAGYSIENETYANYVVSNVKWNEVESSETTDTDFVKVVTNDGKTTVFHAVVEGPVDLGDIHSEKAIKSNAFYKLTLKNCANEMSSEGKMTYDFTYGLMANEVDLAVMEAGLNAAE